MELLKAFVYMSLLTCSIFANKYVLTVLGFKFPMVFQGWQVLVGCCTFKILSALGAGVPKITALDLPGFASLLPNFVLFTIYIIAGSKALATLPVIVYITAGINLIPAGSHIIDFVGRNNHSQNMQSKCSRTVQLVCTFLVIFTAVTLLLLTESTKALVSTPLNALDTNSLSIESSKNIDLMYGAKFWLCVHVGCGLALSLHTRGFADQRFSFTDRVFYSYLFSLVVLLPASLYLEEAFEALHFGQRREVAFVISSLIAALLGVSLNVYQAKLKEDIQVEKLYTYKGGKLNGSIFKFGFIHHTSLAICGVLSAAFFETGLSTTAWIISIINVLAMIPIPSHIKPDESIPLNSDLPVKMTNIRYCRDVDMKPEKYAYTELSTKVNDSEL